MTRTLVIGVGNPNRGDDGLGLEAAQRLRAIGLDGASILESGGDAAGLMAAWQGFERVILLDAASNGGVPGEVRRLDASREPLPVSLLHASSHALGVAEAVELARSLGSLPAAVIVYAVEAGGFEAGAPLSREAKAGVCEAVARVLGELRDEAEIC
jgi:hydrogenase maturation protease